MKNNQFSPVELTQLGHQTLGIKWNDGHSSVYEVRNLRLACQCAHCVDEWSHKKLIKDDAIGSDIKPKKIESVGRYALQFYWSDGHSTGIYTFERLRSLCECKQCRIS